MSSGENIEIAIGADSSGLVDALGKVEVNLKSLEGALGGLSGDFEQAGKEAEKAMKDTEKSTDKAADSVKSLTKFMDKHGDALDSVADQAGRADSALSGFASVIDHVSPEMAEMTRLAADVAGGIEQMILALRQAPGMVIAVASSVAVFHFVTKGAREESERFEEANQGLSDSYDRLATTIQKVNVLQDSYTESMDLSLGLIDQTALALRRREEEADRIFNLEVKRERQRRATNIQSARNAAEAEEADLSFWSVQRILLTATVNREMAINMLADSLTGQATTERRVSEATEEATVAQRANTQVAEENRDENYRLAQSEHDLARAIEERATQINRTLAGTGLFSSELAFLTDASMGMTRHIADEATGAFVMLEDGMRMSSRQARLVGESFAETNEVFARGDMAVESQSRLVAELNELLGHEDDRFSAINITVDGLIESHGALNMVTRQAINVNELYARVIALQRQETVDAAEAEQSAARSRRDANEERLRQIEQLNEMTFQAEQTLRDQVDAHAELYTRDTRMLEELSREYAGFADVQNAIEEARTAMLDEFIHERNEMRQEESDAAFQSARRLEDMLRSLDSISEGRTFETFAYRNRLLEEHRDEQLLTLERMREDLKLHGADQATIDRSVAAERLAINEEFEQARSELNDERRAAEGQKLKTQVKLEKEAMKSTLDTAVFMTGALLDVTSMMEEHMSQASEKEAKRFFRMRQAAAIADILMTTQQAVMRALADLGPIAGAAAGIAIGATSAANIAMVASEKPPGGFSFDVGGSVRGGVLSETPDQISANVLPGEAILNRSATESLGESGVNALNSGAGMGGVVVVPAYRHFDRFIQDEYRKGGSFRRLVDKERQYPVGQRRY